MSRLNATLQHPRFVPFCFLAFLVPRLLILLVPLEPASDASWYVARGLEIAAGQGYQEAGLPTAFWPVGYPGFLGGVFWLFGPHLLAAKLVNLLLSCGVFALTLHVARRTFRDETVARLAVLLLALYPNQIAYTGVLFSEMLATFLLLLAATLFLAIPRRGCALAAGLVIGAGALVKAQFLLFPLVLVAFHLWERRSWRGLVPAGLRLGLPLVIGVGMVVLPWTARNHAVLGGFVLISTNGGGALLEGNNPDATGTRSNDVSLMLTRLVDFTVADQVAADKRARAVAVNWVKENPLRALSLMPRKAWHLWTLDGEGEWWFQLGYPDYQRYVAVFRAVRMINQGYYLVALACAGLGVVMLWRRGALRRDGAGLGCAIILFITGISMIFTGQSRFHFPAMPWVFIYAACFLAGYLRDRGPAVRPVA